MPETKPNDPKTTAPVTPAGPATPGDEVLREAGLRALQAEREQNTQRQAKIDELQAKLDEVENAKLGEAEKWQRKYEAEAAKVKQYETKAKLDTARREIAKKLGIEDHADLLAGDDEVSMTAHAEKLAAALGPKAPAPNPNLGAEPTGAPDAEAQARQILLG